MKEVVAFEKSYKDNLLSPKEKILMQLIFSKENTKEKIEEITKDLDVYNENMNYLLMLSCYGYNTDWLYFPKEIIPRLKEIHKFYQIRNSMSIPVLISKLKVLEKNNIPVMLVKGIAMKIYYDKKTPRMMGDFDLVVPEEKYDDAIKLLKGKDDECLIGAAYATTIISNKVQFDIHRWVFKSYGEKNSDVWEKANRLNYQGVNIMILSPEDMLIHLLDTRCRDIFFEENLQRRMKWLYDSYVVFKSVENFDLSHLAKRAKELNAFYHVTMMINLFSTCFENVIPKDVLEKEFPQNKKYYKWLNRYYKYSKILKKYKAIGYDENSPMTPIHIFGAVRKDFAEYRCFKLEVTGDNFKPTFWRYFKMVKKIDNFYGLLKRYFHRISLSSEIKNI